MGEVNEYLVLEYVRDHRRTTRPDIARDLNLSQASVSRMVSRLIARGVLVESGDTSGSGGRPRVVLTLNVESACVVGIDLGGTKCHGALSGLDGKILAEEYVTVADAGGAFDALEWVWNAMRAAAAGRGVEISALAVGVPAVIDADTDLAVRGPNVGWAGFDLVDRVRAFGVPFVVDNDVNLAAIAEGEVGQAVGARDYAVLSIGTGLGGAVVSNGRLVRGRHHAAGEIGVLVPEVGMLADTRAGSVGGLESVLSGAAIAGRARALAAADPTARAELGDEPTAREVIAAGLAGRPHSKALLDDVVRALAQAVITFAAVTDPETVVIDGSVGRALAPLLDDVTRLVARHVETPPRLAVSDLGPNSTVRGALSGALHHLRLTDAPSVLGELTHEGGTPS
ncbi:ROK family transcriptional regulator [Cellulomonas dongxiuzhuiae]|uniref:ROK family transcriptional regulator n=1 Tax=Cellulomonas dongxiuzhuiae TaxID=2819979 RepID=A0ABX8GMT6_9CELL|nr:ROK family transcriptional regulator [Cellulomonas dongxiuzhuiae]MBO3089812.1 ROK family transcriptional regulator [Cellulomonas dongxiuzhuiae]MBO3095580.1 ROK family transcriptional regulator [Cellulomonas dongxiuzhuiae]QWC16549.1 ROK family transcriptional regulator [Cellulomonas dongxiuzhuiae]